MNRGKVVSYIYSDEEHQNRIGRISLRDGNYMAFRKGKLKFTSNNREEVEQKFVDWCNKEIYIQDFEYQQ